MRRPGQRDTRKSEDDAAKQPTAPLLMMPLRLEYRLIRADDKLVVRQPPKELDEIIELRTQLARTKPGEEKVEAELGQRLAELSALADAAKPSFEPPKLEAEQELWLRWYPDDNFAEAGIGPASETEQAALDALAAHPRAEEWPKLDDPEQIALWSELVAVAGFARAVHLVRNQGTSPDPQWEARIGRIPALPDRVAIFGKLGQRVRHLAEGGEIEAKQDFGAGVVSYSPSALGAASWVSDFDAALQLGMATKVQDPELVDLALKAEWLIAVGLSPEAGPEAVEQILNERIASGAFEMLAQDTPTNNTPEALAGAAQAEDPVERLLEHTKLELEDTGADDLDIARLAKALGIDRASLAPALGAAQQGHADAAAMIRVIGPALMDGALDATTQLDDISDADFIELLAEHVQAGGLYPSLRFGTGAYGLLPVTFTATASGKDTKMDDAQRDFEGFIRSLYSRVRAPMGTISDATTLRLEPDDPDASEKLEDVLQTSRVSRRLDVAGEGRDDVAGLGCPYVDGEKPRQKAPRYLQQLLTDQLVDLPVPDETDREWPLLYRLAHLGVMRTRVLELLKGTPGFQGRGALRRIQGNWRNGLTTVQQGMVNTTLDFSVTGFSEAPASSLGAIPPPRRRQIRRMNLRMRTALLHLDGIARAPDGSDRLETLMMEVIDLFQHRLDAWVTGLASIRLGVLRDTFPDSGLQVGWFGFLGKLRAESATGQSDGYLQAPSLGQAVSAAILRSAFLRNRAEGAFQIDLSSARTRRALGLMDRLRQGVPLPDALGLLGERWLRNKGQTPLIYDLRDRFALENADSDGAGTRGPAGRRGFDGLALAQAKPGTLPEKWREVRAFLAQALDALADVVVAEAVHSRAGGSAEVAAAWLRVLSGGPIPERPDFLRTQRNGHASDYRVSFVLPQVPARTQGAPLTLAEYGLASLIEREVPVLKDPIISVVIRDADQQIFEIELGAQKHLGLDAMHLARLGVAGLVRRVEDTAIAIFHARTPFDDMQRRGWVLDREGLAQAGMQVIVDLDGLEEAIETAQAIWGMAHAGEPLSPGDLANAASPANPLDEPSHIAAIMAAGGDMWARADRLQTRLKTAADTLEEHLKAVFDFVEVEYTKPGRVWGDDMRSDAELHERIINLHRDLAAIAPLTGEGLRIRPAAPRFVEDMQGLETALRQGLKLLRVRLEKMRRAGEGRVASADSLSAARASLKRGMEAVRAGCGEDGLALFPVIPKGPATTPVLLGQTALGTALDVWPLYRAKLGKLVDLFGASPAWPVHPSVTADDAGADDADTRPETLSPRAYHHGTFVGHADDMAADTLSGILVDQWSEFRPSRQQNAALALNYDAPQAEAPNTLLLAVPAAGTADWTLEEAAQHVSDLIDLVRIRALSTQTTPLDDTILPLANLVAHVGGTNNERPRIPQAAFQGVLRDWFDAPGLRRVVGDAEIEGLGQPWNQTNRFTANRRRRQ